MTDYRTNWGRKKELPKEEIIVDDPYPSHDRRKARRLAEQDKRWANLWPKRKEKSD